jgi:hypothetical protein
MDYFQSIGAKDLTCGYPLPREVIEQQADVTNVISAELLEI